MFLFKKSNFFLIFLKENLGCFVLNNVNTTKNEDYIKSS